MPILSGQHRGQRRNRYRDLQPVAGLTVLMKPNNAISAVPSRSAIGLMMLTITASFTDGVPCANSIFGDPISWVVKHCDYADAIEATPTPTRRLPERSR